MKTFAALLAAGWLAGAAGASRAAEEIRIGWVHAVANAPVLVADRSGYFEEQGLDATLRSFGTERSLEQAVVAGEIDLAYISAPPVYHWFSQGLESRIVAKVSYGQAVVVSRTDSGITSLAGLKGRTIAGVREDSGMDVLLRGVVLAEAGGLIPDRDTEILSLQAADMGPSVESKIVDAAFMREPFVSQFLLRGGAQVVFDINVVQLRYPWYVISAMPEAMDERPGTIVKALRAHAKAVDFLNSDADSGNELVAAAFDLGDVTGSDGTVYPATEVVRQARTRLGWESRLHASDVAFLQRLMDWSLALGHVGKRLTADALVDRSFAARAAGG